MPRQSLAHRPDGPTREAYRLWLGRSPVHPPTSGHPRPGPPLTCARTAVAQWIRAPAYEAGGRTFESCRRYFIHHGPRRWPMSAHCLLLNASYEPLGPLISLSRAMRLVLTGRAEIVEDEGRTVRAAERELRRPVVLRLVSYVAVPRRHRRGVTNTWLFARDGYRCAYCGRHERELGAREFLTRDHVH